jgi:carboxymethylenebutenolidase
LFRIAKGRVDLRESIFRIWWHKHRHPNVPGAWLNSRKRKLQRFVDAGRIAVSGCSYGGIQTLLAGERDLGVKALIPFAPGAMSWDKNSDIPNRLRRAVDRARAPIFLLQAENDYSVGPSHVLSNEAEKKRHKDFHSKIYAAFGNTQHDGHWGFCSTATDVWGSDVLAFLDEQMRNTK